MKQRKPEGHGISRLQVKEPAKFTFYSPLVEQRKKEAALRKKALREEYIRKGQATDEQTSRT